MKPETKIALLEIRQRAAVELLLIRAQHKLLSYDDVADHLRKEHGLEIPVRALRSYAKTFDSAPALRTTLRQLRETATRDELEEWREMGRSLWNEIAEAVREAREAQDWKAVAELTNSALPVYKTVGQALGVAADVNDPQVPAFNLNMAIVGAPQKQLDPMASTGKVPKGARVGGEKRLLGSGKEER